MATASGRSQDTDDIKRLLQQRAEALAHVLLPDGERKGNYWIAPNPSRADASAGSFWVWIAGDRAGAYCDAATGQKGDAFGLIQLVTGTGFNDAKNWARDWLGLTGQPAAEIKRRIAAAPRSDPRDAEQKLADGRLWARRTFRASKIRPFAGSPADLYLKGRGIDLRTLGRQPGVLGWLPDTKHRESGLTFPVMVAAMQTPDGETAALHRTFLAPSRDGVHFVKAPVDPDRKMYPSFIGSVIRIWRGETGMREREAEANGLLETLVLTEGVEDALSLAMAQPKHRVWAVGTLGNLLHVPVPACADRIIVHVDNDWGKPQAQRQMREALSRLVSKCSHVSTIRSHIGKDANDALRGLRKGDQS